MNKIDALIAELCPHGVEFKELGACTAYSNTRIDANELDESNFVGVDNLLQNKVGKTAAKYFPNTTRLTAYEIGDVLLGNIRPYLKKIWLADNSGGCSGDVLAIRITKEFQSRLFPNFLYYLLSSDSFFAYNVQHAKGAKMPRGSKEAILKFLIPVPPLPVQEEIVRILDAFTLLTADLAAELTAELEARKQQYAYYRDELLSFGDDVQKMKLESVAKITRGVRVIKSQLESAGGYPVYQNSMTPLGYYGKSNCSAETTFVISAGAAGEIGYSSIDFWAADDCFCFSCVEHLNSRFLYYALLCQQHYIFSQVRRASVPRLARSVVEQLKIPIPPLEEQARIVAILDKFDTLVNDLSSGLPAEIAARRQQYEHYRNKLLTFTERV